MKLGRSFNDASFSSKTPQQERHRQWWSMECWTGLHLCCVGAEWRCFNLGRGRWFEFHPIHFSFEDLSKTSFWFTIYIYIVNINTWLGSWSSCSFFISVISRIRFLFRNFPGDKKNFWNLTSAFFSLKGTFPLTTHQSSRRNATGVPFPQCHGTSPERI